MLVLKLKANDCITIGGGTVLTVKRTTGSSLRLAISAPDDQEITHARYGRLIDDTETLEDPAE